VFPTVSTHTYDLCMADSDFDPALEHKRWSLTDVRDTVRVHRDGDGWVWERMSVRGYVVTSSRRTFRQRQQALEDARRHNPDCRVEAEAA
jgi:hypothetical protein